MSAGRRGAVAGPLLVAIVAAAGIVWGVGWPPAAEPSPPTAGPPALSAQARALLGGLAPGDTLVGWEVRALSGPDAQGTIRIDLSHRDLAQRDLAFSLLVAPKDTQPQRAPVQTEHWAVFYGHVDPPGTVLSAHVIRATTHALANRVRAHE